MRTRISNCRKFCGHVLERRQRRNRKQRQQCELYQNKKLISTKNMQIFNIYRTGEDDTVSTTYELVNDSTWYQLHNGQRMHHVCTIAHRKDNRIDLLLFVVLLVSKIDP